MENNKELFDDIYRKYNKKLYNYIYFRVKDELVAEEIMQEAFIVYLEKDEANRDIDPMKILKVISKNMILNYYRKLKTRNKIFSENKKNLYEEKIIDPDEFINDNIFSKEIIKYLDDLPDYQRKVFIMHAINKIKQKDIAKALGKTENSIKQTLHKARKTLQDNLEKEYPGIKERYRKAKKLQIFIAVLLGASLLSGMVYAAIKTYDYISNKTKTFTMEEKEIKPDESSVKIKRKEAESKIEEYLKTFKVDDYDLSQVTLKNDLIKNKSVWILKTDYKFELLIDANTGELIKYNYLDDYGKTNNKKSNKHLAQENIKEIISKVEIEEYTLVQSTIDITNDSKILKEIYLRNKENNISVIFVDYSISHDRLLAILRQKINNDTFIEKEKAIEIVKEKYKVNEVDNVELYINYNEKFENRDYLSDEDNYSYEKIDNYLYWKIHFNTNRKIYINLKNGEMKNIEEDFNYEKQSK